MKDTSAYIERVRQINAQFQHLELAAVDDSLKRIKPGHSLLVRQVDRDPALESWHPYLREQWWPVGFTAGGTLLIERPITQTYQPGQFLSILGPVGEPYKFRKSLRNVLLIAWNTPPTPLTIMLPLLLKNRISATLVLLGAARTYDTAHLPPEIEIVRGDDSLTWEGQVMTLGWADQVFAVVGQDDELYRFGQLTAMIREKRIDIPEQYLFGIFQPLLPCGIGACHACLIRMKGEAPHPLCIKGPALDLTQVILPLASPSGG